MTKPGESDGFRASDFMRLVCEYLGTTQPLDYLLVNNAEFPEKLRGRYLSYGWSPKPIPTLRSWRPLKPQTPSSSAPATGGTGFV